MNKLLRSRIAAACLLMPCAATLIAVPSIAAAQQAALELRSIEVESDGDLAPGARLRIKVMGSPRGVASLRIRGIREPIALREVGPGVYVGRYTIKRSDLVDEGGQVRATLRAGGRTAAAGVTLAEAMNGPPVASAAPAPVIAAPVAPRIERFSLAPVDRIEPGAELRFSLVGIPGASVTVDLPGVANDIALREVRPGNYEGAYTIRRSDNPNTARPIVATLRVGDRAVSASLALATPAQAIDNQPPNVVNLSPRPGEVLAGGPNTRISASFDDRGGSGVDPASVRITLSGRNITSDAQIDPNSFSVQASLPPGHHTVDVSARDRAGNAIRKDWSFDVAAVVPINLPLQVLNHGNNGTVQGGSTMVEGRTAPFASVAVTVDATPPLGGAITNRHQVFAQTVQADATGRFAFTFTPRYPIPGTRYEIDMVANKASATTDAKLVLFQRQG